MNFPRSYLSNSVVGAAGHGPGGSLALVASVDEEYSTLRTSHHQYHWSHVKLDKEKRAKVISSSIPPLRVTLRSLSCP